MAITINPAKRACTGTRAWWLAVAMAIILGIAPAPSAATPTKQSKSTVKAKVVTKNAKESSKIKAITKKTTKTSKATATIESKAKVAIKDKTKTKTKVKSKDIAKIKIKIKIKAKSKAKEKTVATTKPAASVPAPSNQVETETMQSEAALAAIKATAGQAPAVPLASNDGAVSVKDVYPHPHVVPVLVSSTAVDSPKFTWSATTSPLQCKLRYGNFKHVALEFSQKVGSTEKLLVDVNSSVGFQLGIAKLLLSPSTGQSSTSQIAWQFKISEDKKPIIFSTAQAQQLLAALGDGMQPSIDQQNSELVKFEIDSALLEQPYLAYVQCQQKLVTVSLDEVKNSNIYFASDSTLLNRDALQWLEHVVAYAKDLNNYKIKLIGYTDNFGNASINEKVSTARVNRVASYLRIAGIQDERVVIQIKPEENLGAVDSDNYGKRRATKRVGVKISY